jgi:hypothetical protein
MCFSFGALGGLSPHHSATANALQRVMAWISWQMASVRTGVWVNASEGAHGVIGLSGETVGQYRNVIKLLV